MPKPRKSAFEEPYAKIIERLIIRRRELNITQAELGALYGEDQSFVSRIERRQRRLDVYEFVRFCCLLQIEPTEALKGIE